MCWKLDVKYPLVKEYGPKKVYKVLTKDRISPFLDYKYDTSINEEVMLYADIVQVFEKDSFYNIGRGYHSYSDINVAKKMCEEFNDEEEADNNYRPYCIYECEIPEGVKYYENRNSEIVSSNIIIKEKL